MAEVARTAAWWGVKAELRPVQGVEERDKRRTRSI